MFDRLWCLHETEPRGGPLNMAIDELLLDHASATGQPALRTYRWDAPFVSIGFFDRIEDAERDFAGRPMVRRWTGGGAVDHADDFTFTLAIPPAHSSARWPATRRYLEIHAAVAAALSRLGVATESVGRMRAIPPGSAAAPCFAAPVCGDLMWAGRKLVGGAQRRTRIGVLHQGSIQPIPPGVGRAELAEGLSSELGRETQAITLDGAWLNRAEELARTKYAEPGWLRAR